MIRNSSRALLLALFSSFALLSLSAIPAFAQCGSFASPSTSWNGTTGSFSASTNPPWSNGTPTSTLNTCIINGTSGTPSVVNLSGVTGNVLSLQTAANNTLNISNATLVTNGAQIINGGAINLNGGGGVNTTLELGPSAVLSGTGTLTLNTASGGGQALIETSGIGALTNQSTIQGEGQIAVSVTNSGTITANSAGGALTTTLLLNGATTNTGLLEAQNSGVLQINNTVNNASGNITANGGTVQLTNNATVQGGTLNTVSGGVLGTAQGNSANLDGNTHGTLTINGTYTGALGSVTTVFGTIQNNGNFQLNGGSGNNSVIEVGGSGGVNTTLAGSGTVTLSSATGGGQAFLEQSVAGVTLTNNNTIQGEGVIGNNGLSVVNNASGIINANSTGVGVTTTLTLDTMTNTLVNKGLLEASNVGVLQIDGITVNNAGGNITANAGASVQIFGGSTIQGGSLTNNGGGAFLGTTQGNSATLDGSTASGAITLHGTYTGSLGSVTTILGTINNNNNIQLNGGSGSNSVLEFGNTTLQGGGTVTLNTQGGGGQAFLESNTGTTTLTNVNNTIQGNGVIGNNGLTVINQSGGTINANVSGGTLDLVSMTGGLTNQGLVEATNGGILQIDGVVVNNKGGQITAGSGSTVQLFGSSTIQGGTLTNNGTFLGTTQGNAATLDGSTASGAVTINGTYTSNLGSETTLVGTINNKGNILLNAGTGSNAIIFVGSASATDLTLQGSGTLTLNTQGGGGIAFLESATGSTTLTNVNNTIQGNGVIGNNGLTVVNQATINANVTGGTLELVTMTGGLTNQSLTEATNGGILQINGVTVNNQGGLITAVGAGSAVQLEGSATIQGGTLTNNGGTLGTIQGQTATLDGSTTSGAVTINGTYTAALNTDTTLLGTINNQGNIQLNGGSGNNSFIFIGSGSSTVTLQGGGTLTLNTAGGGGTAFVESASGSTTLTNVNNIIQGNGIIGNNGLTLDNNVGGSVIANVSGGTLTLSAGPVNNAGLLKATNGGTLELVSNTVNNAVGAGGNITADGGTVVLNSSVVQGGTLNTLNGGTMETISGGIATLDGSTHGMLTISSGSTYTGTFNSETFVNGTINNQGNIQINGGSGNNTEFILTANTTLQGGGTLTLNTAGGGGNTFIEQNVGGLTLTNTNHTIQGNGIVENGLSITNAAGGLMNANVNGQAFIFEGGGTLDNSAGTLEASNGGTFHQTASTLSASTFSGGTLNGNYIVDGTVHASTLQLDSLGSTGGEVTTLGNGTLPSSITLNGTNANTLFLDSAGKNALALNTVSANATLNLLGGYAMTTPGALFNSGTVHIGGSGSTLAVGGLGYAQGAGLTQVDAGGTLSSNSVEISGGTLQGTGTVTIVGGGETQIQAGGTLLPGTPGTPGTISFNGVLAINNGGTLTETINGSSAGQFGVTNVSGNLLLDSSSSNLNIAQNASFNPAVGTALTIMNAGAPVSGTFANLQNAVFNSSTEQWNAVYNVGGNNVILVSGVVGGGDVVATSTASGSWSQTSPSTNWSCSPATAFACVPNNVKIDTVPINFTANIGNGSNISLGAADGAITVHNAAILNGGNTLTVNSGGSLTVTGNFTNGANGNLQLNGGSIVAGTLTNYSGGTLSGGNWVMAGGTLKSNNITVATGINTIGAGTNVTLGGGGTTSGFLASNGTTDALKALTSNQGNLTVTGGTNFTTTGGTLTNSGGVNITSTSNLTVSGADYDQSASGATTTVGGGLNVKDYVQSGGLTTLSGGTITATNNVGITGGTLQGSGTVAATTTTISGSGILQPGTSGTPATMNVNGALNINSGGTLAETLNGSTAGLFGFTSVGGGLNLTGGVLDILQPGTFDPNAGTAITIMTAGSPVVGNFASIQNQFFNGGTEEWVVSESGDNVILTAQNVTNSFTATWTGPSANWTTNNSNVTPWSCSPSLTPCTPNNVNGNTFSAVLNSAGNTMTLNILSNPTTITVASVDVQHGTLDVAGSTLNTGTLTNSDTFSTELGGRTNATILANYSGGTLSGGTWIMNGGKLEGGNISAGTGITTIAANTTVTLNTGGGNASFLASDGTTDALKALNSNQGTLNVIGGTVFTTNGALTNSGSLSIGSASTVNVGTAGGSDFTNTASTTVSGTLNANNINDSGTTNVESGGLVSATGTYTASGALTIFGNGTLDAGTFDQTGGTTVIDANGTLTANTVDISGGTMQVDGTLDPTAVEVTSILDGAGTIVANVTNDGTVIMGDSTSDPGKLSETGNYTQNADGTLDEAISSSTNGELAVTGNVDLGGKLDISLLGNPTLTADELFTLMTFTGTETGTFASIIGADAGDWTVLYNSNNVELEFTPSTSAVPEPRMVALEIALFLGLVFVYRLTRKKERAL